MWFKEFLLYFVVLLLGKCPTNFVPTIIPRKKKNATNSAFREYDNLLYEDVLPNGQNFAGNDTSTGKFHTYI